MSRALPITELAVRRAIRAARKEGLRVVGIRCDGTLIVDSGDNPHPLIPAQAPEGHAAAPQGWEEAEA